MVTSNIKAVLSCDIQQVWKAVTTVENYSWRSDLRKMENSNMRGHWTGRFVAIGNETEIDFTEQVAAKKFFLRPFVKGYLKKQQAQFVADLKAFLLDKIGSGA